MREGTIQGRNARTRDQDWIHVSLRERNEVRINRKKCLKSKIREKLPPEYAESIISTMLAAWATTNFSSGFDKKGVKRIKSGTRIRNTMNTRFLIWFETTRCQATLGQTSVEVAAKDRSRIENTYDERGLSENQIPSRNLIREQGGEWVVFQIEISRRIHRHPAQLRRGKHLNRRTYCQHALISGIIES